MIYIVTLIGILICVAIFDFGRLKNPQLKNFCYTLLLVWLICLSGFAYNVGADIPVYMHQYSEIGRHSFRTWEDLSIYENRQPGWILLNIICSRIYSKFVLLQLVIAVFSNIVILNFIKKHTNYIFLGALIYFICSYLNFNFNSIRQTVAIAFFLIAYDYLVDKKWIKYYLFVFCAFMFHSTAVICALFPLFTFVKFNKTTIYITLVSIIVLAVLALLFNGAEMVSSFFLENADFAGYFTDREQIVENYFGDNAMKYGGLNFFGIIFMFITALPIFLVIYSGAKKIVKMPNVSIVLIIFYLTLFVLDYVVPIVFMRFIMYLDILFYCYISNFALDYPKRIHVPSSLFAFALLCLICFRPVNTLFSVNQSSGLVFYRQFYPYYSVLDPQIDPVRASYFGCYRDYK